MRTASLTRAVLSVWSFGTMLLACGWLKFEHRSFSACMMIADFRITFLIRYAESMHAYRRYRNNSVEEPTTEPPLVHRTSTPLRLKRGTQEVRRAGRALKYKAYQHYQQKTETTTNNTKTTPTTAVN